MLEEYKRLHGRDLATAWQTEEILKEPNLEFVLRKLEEAKKLPRQV
jgi:hypothetical protein